VPRLALVLALPLLAAACGGSGGSETPAAKAPPRLTQAQFVAAANAVCLRSDRRVYRLGRLSLDPRGWARTAAEARRGVADMERLRPPLARQSGFDALLQEGRRLAAGIQKVHDALVEQDLPTARRWQLDATAADTAIHREAQKLGLTFCQQLLTNWPA
jgi:hypothetical protein